MLLTYQYKLNPTDVQSAIMAEWGELLRRHWNYALAQRLDNLRRNRCQIDRCSLVSEPIGEIEGWVDYYKQSSELKETKRLFPEYKSIYADCQQQNLMRLDKAWKHWLTPDKTGKRGGRPRFKKRGNLCSFTFPRVNSAKAEFHYQVAHWICVHYDLIAFEELNIKGLARTRLAKSILDAAWGGFLHILQAVAVKRGKQIAGTNPRGTSIECSDCGNRVVKDLSVRVHSCECGLVIDRDQNAGINILNRVLRAVGLPLSGCRGLGVALPVKQQFSVVKLDAPARPA